MILANEIPQQYDIVVYNSDSNSSTPSMFGNKNGDLYDAEGKVVGSKYTVIENGKETVYGKAYTIQNGDLTTICEDNQKICQKSINGTTLTSIFDK